MEYSEKSVQFPIITPAEPDRWPRGIGYRDGFRIIGTPMGFGRARDAKLRFVASLNERTPRKHERILMNRPLFTAMGCESRNVDVLAVDFGQKIRLGRMEIELFPAGLGLGSAQLRLSYRNRRILYCGGIRLAKPLHSPPCEIPTCDVLLLDVAAAPTKPGAPARTAKALFDWLETAPQGSPSLVVCASKTAALDALWVLKSRPERIYAAKSLYDLFRRCSGSLGRPRNLSRLEQSPPQNGVVLIPDDSPHIPKLLGFIPEDRIARVGVCDGAAPVAAVSFRLGDGEDRAGLAAYVRQTGAAEVVLGQACDESLLRILRKDGRTVFRVTRPVQIPFPFLSRRQ